MIVPTLAILIAREHRWKPIRGRVLTLGKQSIAMTYNQAVKLLREEGCELEARRDDMKLDDKGFFNLLGLSDVSVMDISDYEGAGIIHDLNKPVPEELYNQFDFIIDGGTFDHLFDIRTAFENIVEMLKPNGRIFHWNAASNAVGAAYLSFSPELFYDYYVANGFDDCKVYVGHVNSFDQKEHWEFYEYISGNHHLYSRDIQIVVVLAEKGKSSTWNRIPTQCQYQDIKKRILFEYQKVRLKVRNSKRVSLAGLKYEDKKQEGYRYVGFI